VAKSEPSSETFLAPIVAEGRALLRLFRTVVLIVVVLGAGVIGGYAGGILAALELDYARQSNTASRSLGMPGIEAIAAQQPAGTFEQIGRAMDQFNAQFEENWRTWESIGGYVFSQGWSELKRVWTAPTPRPNGSPAGSRNTSDI
jgi:hypothetical protein